MLNRLSLGLIAPFLWLLISLNAAYAIENKRSPSIDDVRRFSMALDHIKTYYVKPVKDKQLFDDAIQGMLTGLDPHSTYLDEDAFKELQSSTRGEFGGLGIEVTMEKGVIKVISPLDDTPAYKAGIKSGDYIIRLGKTSVSGLKLKDAVKMMRGKKGTAILLTIIRKGENKPLKFKVVRDHIRIKSVKSKLLDKHYGYIRLSHFQARTAKDMVTAIDKLKAEAGGQLKGLILDLRNNPGGLLDSAIETSDAFINNDKAGKKEMIVYTEGRLADSKFTAYANPGDILNGAAMVVLINGGSASGSEIVAGALQDNKRAILVGTKSFGKGSVQTVLPLDNKHGIKLTTALYYTPSGRSIQAKGVVPDIIIKNVKINETAKDNLAELSDLSEADLTGHLMNTKGKTKEKAKDNKKSTSTSIHQDYQLHQALTLLKGIALAKK